MIRWAAAAALAAGVATGCANLPPTTQQQLAGRSVGFVCADGKRFIAEFNADASRVRLVFPDRTLNLVLRGATDSLLRYSDGQTGFGTTGAQAVLADQVFITQGDCTAQQ